MKSVIFAPAALEALEDIWYFIALDNAQRASRFVREIRDFCVETLGTSPGIGVRRPDLHADIRMAPYQRYLVFYQEKHSTIEIVLITHSSRDQWIGRFFEES